MKRALALLLVLIMTLSLGVQAFADDILFCRMCGKQIPTDSKVCPYCGEKVVHIAEASEQTSNHPEAPAAQPQPDNAAPSTDMKSAPSLKRSSAPSPVTFAAPAEAAVQGPFGSRSPGAGGGRVYVTKSPTSESVPYGGSCSFIAHAANATSVTWYIASSDAGMITTAAEASSVVSGLYVSGAYSDTLSLSGIPSWMNGCQVQACFTGEGGPVYSDAARIWTYQPAQEQEQSCSGWTWWDWFKYYYRNDPYYWDYPWYWYNHWMCNRHEAPFWFRPEHDFDLDPRSDMGKYKDFGTLVIEKPEGTDWDWDYIMRLRDYYSGKDSVPRPPKKTIDESYDDKTVSFPPQGTAGGNSEMRSEWVESLYDGSVSAPPDDSSTSGQDNLGVQSEWVDSLYDEVSTLPGGTQASYDPGNSAGSSEWLGQTYDESPSVLPNAASAGYDPTNAEYSVEWADYLP
jgi:hypothetical protein